MVNTIRRVTIATVAVVLAALVATVQPTGAQDVMCDGRVATIVGTPEDDVITGTPGPDVIFAAQGDDWIDGRGGDDVICAGKGDDTVAGGQGFDIIFGAQGDDRLFAASVSARGDIRDDTKGARMFGGTGNDVLHGSNRWDRMQGGPGYDQLHGYEGRDWLRGGPDRDEINGGPGADDVHGGNGSDRLTVTNGDVVRGGAGVDWCVIGGPAELLRSCGRNRYEPGMAARSYAPGGYAVPREVRHGYYRTTRYFELNDPESKIVVNDFQIDNGPTVAIVDPRGATVVFRGPASRVEAGGPVAALGLSNGRVLVGLDIAPGTYRVTPSERSENTSMTTYDGRGRLLDIVAGVGPNVLIVPPEAVFLDFNGVLERAD